MGYGELAYTPSESELTTADLHLKIVACQRAKLDERVLVRLFEDRFHRLVEDFDHCLDIPIIPIFRRRKAL